MGSSAKVEASKEELKRSQDFWSGFTCFMKYGVLSVVGVLVLMAIFLL